MTPYSIITVFQIGLLLLVMRLYSQSFIFIITNAGAKFTVSRKPYFSSDCGLSFIRDRDRHAWSFPHYLGWYT